MRLKNRRLAGREDSTFAAFAHAQHVKEVIPDGPRRQPGIHGLGNISDRVITQRHFLCIRRADPSVSLTADGPPCMLRALVNDEEEKATNTINATLA